MTEQQTLETLNEVYQFAVRMVTEHGINMTPRENDMWKAVRAKAEAALAKQDATA